MAGSMVWRVARRELRGGAGAFVVFMICLAVGVASIAGVGQLGASVEATLRRDAKVILGGDLEVQVLYQPPPNDLATWLGQRGRVSLVAGLRVMAGLGQHSSLAELKAVDGAYPLLGRVDLRGGGDLGPALAQRDGRWGAVAAPELADRLGARVGDVIDVGQGRYELRGILAREPDRAGSFVGFGPRLLVALDSLEPAGLLQPGSLVQYRLRVSLDRGADPNQVRRELEARPDAGGWQVRDFTSAGRGLDRWMDRMGLNLILVSLCTLLVGGVGVAGAVRVYLEKKDHNIAALKCLGATRAQVVGAYLAQVLVMALLGSVLGLGVGAGLAWLGAGYLGPILGLALERAVDPWSLLVALCFGLLVALCFSLVPVSQAAETRPARLFSGFADPVRRRARPLAWLLTWLSALGIWGLTWMISDGDPRITFGFAGAVLGSLLVFGVYGWGLKRLAAALPSPRDPRLRHALANLHRPGSTTSAVVLSLGLGLAALVAVSLVEANLRVMLNEYLPREAPSYFFLDIPPDRMAEFRQKTLAIPGVTHLEAQPSLMARVEAINGVPADQVKIDPGFRWVVRRERGISFAATPPEGTQLVAGQWWPPDYAGPPIISFDQWMAQGLGVGIGDTLTLNVMGRAITARVFNLRHIDWASLRLNHAIVFAPGAIEAAPHTFLATAQADPAGEKALYAMVRRDFPGVLAIYTRDVLDQVAEIMGRLGLCIRVTALVTLLVGLLVLAETVRANLHRRYYESVVLKVFGATRADVLITLGWEFLLQGAATAVLAGAVGAAIAWGFVEYIMRAPWILAWRPLVLISLGGALAALVLGLTGVGAVLGKKAWPVLRNE